MAVNLADILKGVSDSDTGLEQIEYIPLTELDEDPDNFYQLSGIAELADNIALCGLQQPIRVRQKEGGRYVIVSGHRRRAALEALVAYGYDHFSKAACIVERDEVSPTLQQLRLIYANASTRKMTAAETAEEADRVTNLLYKLQEEGYEFPGRMRDHVAQAMSISKTKLARLKVIRENLDESWADAWKAGTLTESQAYELAQMHRYWQAIIKEEWGYGVPALYADTIRKFRQRFEAVQDIPCKHGLTVCEHTAPMMRKNVCRDWAAPCTGCCFDCDRLQNCKNCCPEAAGKKKELKDIAKKANQDAKREQEERDHPGAEFARMVWDRIGKARERSGASVKDIVLARGESFYSEVCDEPKQKKMENGEGDYKPVSTVSFGYNITAQDLMKVNAVADVLNCSVDYLLGRTDRMDVVSESGAEFKIKKVSYSDTIWRTGEPEALGSYLLALRPAGCSVQFERWSWDGIGWKDFTGYHSDDVDGEIVGWTTLPEVMTE